jgi:serine/threonine protein kinase
VKPENILYFKLATGEDKYQFKLGDFGLANHVRRAKTFCGTSYYMAPELFPEYGRFPQCPKMDMWSLAATLLHIFPEAGFPPRDAHDYDSVIRALRTAAATAPFLRPMVRMNPFYRASAAQMLATHFAGNGLTTPRSLLRPLARKAMKTQFQSHTMPYNLRQFRPLRRQKIQG